MGVPKFFRWLSERYPAISQLIADSRIPEFDCLYLDMNGIIHNCTHKDSDDPAFRMTEETMFIAIFNYIEHLFSKIKPKKLFFMAVDGVAPRAKMNQQRARRFRTALDAERAREKAIMEGVEMPKEDPFDSNCITPGTDFMARLSRHLRYFVNKKVSEDTDWQGVEIVLSGHEVPGEGEHKIMEYIRQAKAQPEYDPNMRHCLYGLDADLIMLGLLSHDPHFCLLREEVTFGRQSKTKSKELEHQNFYLLHLCIVREYLELEFQELKEPETLNFPFDMERIIDDFILMAFFVGNDFLPNLPHLHINEGALALMFGVYKVALPKAGGYINESGVINMSRLAILLDELSHVEFRFFESEHSDAKWFKGKQMGREDVMERARRKGQVTMSSEQQKIFRNVEEYVQNRPSNRCPLDLSPSLPARDRKFVEDLADDLHLKWKTVHDEEGNRHMQLNFPTPILDVEGQEESGEEDVEADLALNRVLNRYRNAKIVDVSATQAQEAMEQKYEHEFQKWKNEHYQSKFDWDMNDEHEMTKLTENYVQGLQWVLFYYYRGIASWPWFYAYHYAPMISDVKKGLNADINFKLGQPFLPFQQLMGVLPDRSKKIVPLAYHELMTSKDSPIIDFYPRDFELDMNGKKMEWEAVVKIPFIEESRLLKAMATKESALLEDERARNSFGVSLKFVYDSKVDFTYMSSLPGYFPDLEHCRCVENIFDLPVMDGLEVYVGLMDGALLGLQSLAGFPSLKTLPFTGQLGFHGVNVFQQDSRNESMVVTLAGSEDNAKLAAAKARLGKAVFVGYPFLNEAKVVKVSDDFFDYTLDPKNPGVVAQMPHTPREIEDWKRKANRIENTYSKKLGMIIGSVEALVHVEPLIGLVKQDDGATVKQYGLIPGTETDYATQVIVDDVYSADQRFIEKAALPVEEEFPVGSRAFFLGEYAYGRPLEVMSHDGNNKMSIWVSCLEKREAEFGRAIVKDSELLVPYVPSYTVARSLNLPALALSKITSALSVNSSGLRLNMGLNLKFEAKKLKVLGYSRRSQSGWEFSQKAINLIQEYMVRFPEFIAGIALNPKGDIYEDEDFYPKATAKQKMKEIGEWLRSIESNKFERVPLEAEQLDSEIVAKIEQAAISTVAESETTQKFKMLKAVPRNALLNTTDAEQRISGQQFALGDRVVYVLASGRVPIAQRGTVVGMTRTSRQTLLDIVFDASFISGTTLGERCSPFRGSTVPSDAVLNISNRQVVALSKASAARQPAPVSTPIQQQQRRFGQSVPAPAPPPLRGSFQGAVRGINAQGRGQLHAVNGMVANAGNRGRGRGGFGMTNGMAQHQQQHGVLPFRNDSPRGGSSIVRGYASAAGGGTPSHGRGGSPAYGNTSNGANQRGRGSGSAQALSSTPANRSGYTIVDKADPMAGVVNNPGFRPNQAYHHVPPPTGIDGRGRGGRGGRGTPGRGRGGTVQPGRGRGRG